MLKRSTLVLATVLALRVAGTAFAQEVDIALISKGVQQRFWLAVKAGAEQAARDLGVRISFEGPESEAMGPAQIALLSAALAKHPKAIGFAAIDSKAAGPLLEKAQAARIPVIAFDSGVDSDVPVTTATTDNLAAAGLAADRMAELIGKEGEVAVIVHDRTSRTGIDRRDGFVNRMRAAYPRVEIVAVEYGGGAPRKSAEVARAILRGRPNLRGIFGANEGSAVGVLDAAREMTRKIVIVGFDAGARQKAAVRSGEMAGAITQDPVGIGYKTVEAAVKALRGEPLPKVIDTGFHWYDRTNLDDPRLAPLLYD